MARKKAETGGGPGSGDWLNTYADMVTLLLTFFILLFSMSSLDASKFNLIVSALKGDARDKSNSKIVVVGSAEGVAQEGLTPLGAEEEVEQAQIEKELEKIYQTLKQRVQESKQEENISISKGEGYVFIRFMNDMLFEPNRAVLKPSDREILQFVGNEIKSVQNKADMISIHGHTAAIPDNPNYAVNDWKLSSDRANAVLLFFDERIGIDPKKMQTVTWGKNKPFTSNDTEEGRSKNRRVEILISTNNPISEELDNVYEKLIE